MTLAIGSVRALVAWRVRRVTSASLIGLKLIGLQRRIKREDLLWGTLEGVSLQCVTTASRRCKNIAAARKNVSPTGVPHFCAFCAQRCETSGPPPAILHRHPERSRHFAKRSVCGVEGSLPVFDRCEMRQDIEAIPRTGQPKNPTEFTVHNAAPQRSTREGR